MIRALFEERECATCHGGSHWTSSILPGLPGNLDPNHSGMVDEVLRDVGTLNPLDVRGASGFVPPSLVAVGLTAPYLHDGSIASLEELLATGHPTPWRGNDLSAAEVAEMAAFIRSIGSTTPPIDGSPP